MKKLIAVLMLLSTVLSFSAQSFDSLETSSSWSSRSVHIGSFMKGNGGELKRFSIPRGGFSEINFYVEIGETYAPIVNAIAVLSGGRAIEWKNVGARLQAGDNYFYLNVPHEADAIQISFDHGRNAYVDVYVE